MTGMVWEASSDAGSDGAVALAAAAAALAAVRGEWHRRLGAAARRPRPNIVVLMSDDQTLEEMRFMPRTERLIGDAGATFPDSVVNWPLCCPSRATFMTGQYAHNHGVLGNAAAAGRLRAARHRAHAAGLAAAVRLLDGPHRQVPERLRGAAASASRRAGRSGTARSGPTSSTATSCSRRGRSSPTARRTRTPMHRPRRRRTRPTSSPTRRCRRSTSGRRPISRSSSPSPTWPRTRAAPRRAPDSRCRGTAKPAIRHAGAARRRAASAAAELQRGRRLRQAAARSQARRRSPPEQIARATTELPLPRRVAAGDRRAASSGSSTSCGPAASSRTR